MCKKYGVHRGFAAVHPILLTQLAKSLLRPGPRAQDASSQGPTKRALGAHGAGAQDPFRRTLGPGDAGRDFRRHTWTHLRRGFAAAHPILLTQLAESELLLPLLPLLLKPLLLLTSQMATLGLTQQGFPTSLTSQSTPTFQVASDSPN